MRVSDDASKQRELATQEQQHVERDARSFDRIVRRHPAAAQTPPANYVRLAILGAGASAAYSTSTASSSSSPTRPRRTPSRPSIARSRARARGRRRRAGR